MVALGYFMTPLLAPECRDLLNAARVNIIGVTNLFEAARLARLQRVIFASTVGNVRLPRRLWVRNRSTKTPKPARRKAFTA